MLPVRVKDELVGREEYAAEMALDALGPRAVVTGGDELAAAAPGTLVENLRKIERFKVRRLS